MRNQETYQNTARRVLNIILPAFLLYNFGYIIFLVVFAKENRSRVQIIFAIIAFLTIGIMWWVYQFTPNNSEVRSTSLPQFDTNRLIVVEHFLQLATQLSIFVVIVDTSGVVKHVNVNDLTQEETDSDRVSQSWIGQKLALIAPNFKPLLDFERLNDGDNISHVVAQDNSTYNAIAYPIMNSAQQLDEVYIICQDMTNEMSALHALEASELRLQKILAEYPDYLMIVRAVDGIVLYSNVETFLDYPLLGRNLLDIMSELQPSDIVDAFRLQWLIITDNPAHTVEPITLTIEHHGESEWVHSRPIYLPRNDSGYDTLLYSLSFVTKQKRAEHALLASEEQLRTIYNQSLDIILVIDQSETIIRANQAIENLLGYSVSEIEGQSFITLLGYSFSEALNEMSFDSTTSALPLITKDGTLRYMELTASIVTWQDDPAIIITLRDVSNEEKMRRKLETARIARERGERERALLEERIQMIFVIEHQLRTPLSSILSAAEVLRFHITKTLPEAQQNRIERIVNDANYIRRMMNDMLTAREAILGNLPFEPREINFKQHVQTLFDQLTSDTQTLHQFNFEYLTSSETLFVDDTITTYILENLIINAIRYSPNGGTIALRVTDDDDNILISVKDEGLGIPKEQQEAIFELFHRGANVSDIRGTGIGLALAFNAAKAHGGELSVESTLGEGSTFLFKFPKRLKTI